MYTIQEQKSSGGDGECHHISHNSASGFINGNYCRGRGMWEIYHDMCVCVGCTCHGTGTSIQQCFISSGCIIYKKHLLLLDPTNNSFSSYYFNYLVPYYLSIYLWGNLFKSFLCNSIL